MERQPKKGQESMELIWGGKGDKKVTGAQPQEWNRYPQMMTYAIWKEIEKNLDEED